MCLLTQLCLLKRPGRTENDFEMMYYLVSDTGILGKDMRICHTWHSNQIQKKYKSTLFNEGNTGRYFNWITSGPQDPSSMQDVCPMDLV